MYEVDKRKGERGDEKGLQNVQGGQTMIRLRCNGVGSFRNGDACFVKRCRLCFAANEPSSCGLEPSADE
jgi:hypothetical protein